VRTTTLISSQRASFVRAPVALRAAASFHPSIVDRFPRNLLCGTWSTGFVSRDRQLQWMPSWRALWLKAMRESGDRVRAWHEAVALATVAWISSRPTPSMPSSRTYLIRTLPADLVQRTVRLAILDSSTFAYLHSGIRLASLRRGMCITTYENGHGQYLQELPDPRLAFHVQMRLERLGGSNWRTTCISVTCRMTLQV
jgi:hypothetical protein